MDAMAVRTYRHDCWRARRSWYESNVHRLCNRTCPNMTERAAGSVKKYASEIRFCHDATPIGVPSGSCASNFPPPKRLPLPAASRIALIIIAGVCTCTALRSAQHDDLRGTTNCECNASLLTGQKMPRIRLIRRYNSSGAAQLRCGLRLA